MGYDFLLLESQLVGVYCCLFVCFFEYIVEFLGVYCFLGLLFKFVGIGGGDGFFFCCQGLKVNVDLVLVIGDFVVVVGDDSGGGVVVVSRGGGVWCFIFYVSVQVV